jgi:hypothetical protein
MWSPQENEPPAPPDSPSAPLLLGKTNGAPAIPSLAALQITTRTPPLPLSSQPNGLMAPNPEPRPFVPEDFGPLDSPPDDMVQRSRSIQSGLSGHNQPSSHFPPSVKSIQKQRPLTLYKLLGMDSFRRRSSHFDCNAGGIASMWNPPSSS